MKNLRIKRVFRLALFLALAGCVSNQTPVDGEHRPSGGVYKVGTPYQAGGSWYYPQEDYSYNEVGIASWYGPDFHAEKTANGETYDMNAMTAAHKTLPLPSFVTVTNLENGKKVVLRVNDRGPFVNNRIIDVSKKAAEELGFLKKGTTKVRVQIMPKESKEIKEWMLAFGKKGVPENAVFTLPKTDGTKPLYEPVKQGQKEILYGKEDKNQGISSDSIQQNIKVTSFLPAGFYIQAGAFASIENAQMLAGTLSSYGSPVIQRTIQKDKEFFRVRVGPFENGQKAVSVMDKMKEEGYSAVQLVQEVIIP
jgi:rare lipoprotein A